MAGSLHTLAHSIATRNILAGHSRTRVVCALSTKPRICRDLAKLVPLRMGQTRRNEQYVSAAVRASELLKAFGVRNRQELKDAFLALALSETVYRVLDPGGQQQAARVADELCHAIPGFTEVQLRMQWSLPNLAHRYMVAQSKDALYVAFMGTKQRRDIVANAKIGLVPIWPEDILINQESPQVHRGFLRRARAINIQSLYKHAAQHGLRLVLCGHSLGGAVAQICALDLLKALEGSQEPCRVPLSCIVYAAPAIGNAAMSNVVDQKGWHHHFINYLLPEDVLGSFFARQKHTASSNAAAALAKSATAQDQAISAKWVTGIEDDYKGARRPDRDLQSMNNIVPCRQPGMVFSRPLHFGLPPPLLRDILSGARGELSSVSLEMADSDAWLFRNGASYRSGSAATQPAASMAHRPSARIAPLPLDGSKNSSALAALTRSSSMPARPDTCTRLLRHNSTRDLPFVRDAPFGSRAACLSASSLAAQARMGDLQSLGDPLMSPCTSVGSSSSLSSLDGEEEAVIATATEVLEHAASASGGSSAGVLRRARLLAGALLLPVSVLGAYAPIGQQFSLLKPPLSAGTINAELEAELVGDVFQLDTLQRRLRTVFWMHRLPVYRARTRQIYDSIASSSATAVDDLRLSKAKGEQAWLADDVAPAMHVEAACIVSPKEADGSNNNKEDGRSAESSKLAYNASALQSRGLLLLLLGLLTTVWLSLWPRVAAAMGWLASQRRAPFRHRTETVLIELRGHGLQHCTAFLLELPGLALLPATVMSQQCEKGSPKSLAQEEVELLHLSVQVPWASAQRLQQESSRSRLHLMSDFRTAVALLHPLSPQE